VHMNQVHKETLTHVENAIASRQGLDIEIFGMEGVPQEIIDQHNQQVTQKHFAEEAERARLTGNPIRGLFSNGAAPPTKKKKVKENLDELEARADKYRHDKANGLLPVVVPETAPNPVSTRISTIALGQIANDSVRQTPPAVQPYGVPPAAAPPFPSGGAYPPPGAPQFAPQSFPPGGTSFPPGFNAPPSIGGGAPHPGSTNGPSGLPQRPPGFTNPPNALPPGANGGFSDISQRPPSTSDHALSASVDELIADASKGATTAPPPEKKGKKDKSIKMIFFDENVSPEEKMTALPRYAQFVRA